MVLPHPEHAEAQEPERAGRAAVPAAVGVDLREPVFLPGPGRPVVRRAAVPEAAVHEHARVGERYPEVRRAGQRGVLPIGDAVGRKPGFEGELGRRVPGRYPGHDVRPFFLREDVHGRIISSFGEKISRKTCRSKRKAVFFSQALCYKGFAKKSPEGGRRLERV